MATRLDPFAQTRTPAGVVPCEGVSAVRDDAGDGTAALVAIGFMPMPPEGAGAGPRRPFLGRASMDLVDLGAAAAVRPGPDGPVTQVSADSLVAFASAHGPLFAREPFAWGARDGAPRAGEGFEEDAGAWVSAATMANLAIVAQQLSQGTLPLSTAGNVMGNLVRWHVVAPGSPDADGFDLVVVARPVTAEYADWLGAPLFVRREEGEGRIDYSFVLRGEEGDATWLEVGVASFARVIDAADYRVLSRALGFSAGLDEEVRERLALGDGAAAGDGALGAGAGRTAPGDRRHAGLADEGLLGRPIAIDEGPGGRELLASLMRALVAAHLRDAYVDVFSASDETGFLSFRSLLSWLWYDFSRGLDKARIKYCVRCGRAFSVVGHRGPDRVFCSDECRNASHNERSNRRRDGLRHEFLEGGRSVADLAAAHFPEERPEAGERRVRQSLQSWPALKHAVDDDIERHGWSSPLLRRCRDEGLDPLRLLTTRRRQELGHMGRGRAR